MTIITKPSSTKKEEKAVPLVDPSVAPSLLVNKEKKLFNPFTHQLFPERKKTLEQYLFALSIHIWMCV